MYGRAVPILLKGVCEENFRVLFYTISVVMVAYPERATV